MYCLPLSSFAAKDANAKNVSIRSLQSFCISNTCAYNIYARNIYINNTFFALDAYIKGTGFDDISIESINRKNTYAKSVYSIKYLRIYLQSFLILKIKLFDTS